MEEDNLGLYLLDENKMPVPATIGEWSLARKDFEENFRVAKTDVGDYWISTIFLGTNYGLYTGENFFFETMVFKGDEADELDMARYRTWDEAVEGHKEIVERWRNKTIELAKKANEKIGTKWRMWNDK